ncbi:transketolase n-terminal protein [Pyrococcus sp. NA2]|uniref:1-deoxy-D-xylulose-5-phosphate synthase N-terminal domain-containing protein n=1 Tax=Pyrococcus sp. (strain NA2) TaxID=342949 RepID=UPI000209A8F3|nr:1-deoxy-D-xylulose-5-phosphate synthase N-terminal domain-containing protein [Pyrococcus sp. NA2]AEC51241.1 transketolase n-terminal protein [Pyrococcus sp. NA2]
MSEALVEKLKEVLRPVNNFHLDSSLSCLSIMQAIFEIKRENDVVIVSKGHSAPAFYVILWKLGLLKSEDLETFAEIDGLPSHITREIPFAEVSSGSLGQGLSVANGIALAKRIDGDDGRVFVILGDGELDEGQIWEAAMTASHYGLDNVIAVVDRNFGQLTGSTEEIMRKEPLAEKWKAFGWEVREVRNDVETIKETMIELDSVKGKPKVIIAKI